MKPLLPYVLPAHLQVPRESLASMLGIRFAEGDGGEASGAGASADPSLSAGQGQQSGQQQYENGFPPNTPTSEMTDAQQAAYWRFQSRKHQERAESRGDYDTVKQRSAQLEDELSALRQAQMSESEKALAEARSAGANEARDAVRAEFADRDRARGIKLVDGFLNLAMGQGGRLDRDRVTPILDAIDKAKYLTADGDVDTEGLGRLVDSLALPAPVEQKKTWPTSMGQGRQESAPDVKSVAAGKALFEARRGGTRTPTKTS